MPLVGCTHFFSGPSYLISVNLTISSLKKHVIFENITHYFEYQNDSIYYQIIFSYMRSQRRAMEKGKRKNNKFTYEEDAKLRKLVNEYGEKSWDIIASHMKGRNIRQVHDRWVYYLSPNVCNSPWTDEEDEKLIHLTQELNGRWVQISKRFNGRNDTQIKNRWNFLKKRLSLPDLPKKRGSANTSSESSSQVSPAPNVIERNEHSLLGSDDAVEAVLDKLISAFHSMENDMFPEYSLW